MMIIIMILIAKETLQSDICIQGIHINNAEYWIKHLEWEVSKNCHDGKITTNLTHGCTLHMKTGHLCTKWLTIVGLKHSDLWANNNHENGKWGAKRVCFLMKLIYLFWNWFFVCWGWMRTKRKVCLRWMNCDEINSSEL